MRGELRGAPCAGVEPPRARRVLALVAAPAGGRRARAAARGSSGASAARARSRSASRAGALGDGARRHPRGARGRRRARLRAGRARPTGSRSGSRRPRALVPGVSRSGADADGRARARLRTAAPQQSLSWDVGLPVILGRAALKGGGLLRSGLAPLRARPVRSAERPRRSLSTLASARSCARTDGRRAPRSLLPLLRSTAACSPLSCSRGLRRAAVGAR